eukprot:12905858-Prorocentrum_lima.AAC.1
MAQELQKPVSRVPAILAPLAISLEDYIHKLDDGMKHGALLEPRSILTVVQDTMDTVVSKDDILKKTM